MSVYTGEFGLGPTIEVDMIDMTKEVARITADSGIVNGTATVFVSGSTGAITTVEYEPGLLKDIPDALERLMPKGMTYDHHLRWHDGNGHSHVRASLLGPSLTVPVREGRPLLGTWQQIVFIELDNKRRERTIHVTVMGE